MDTRTQNAIEGGVATVFTTDFEAAMRFYTEILGLKLVFRAGEHWAQIDAGRGFLIGLHPAARDARQFRGNGGVQIGLNVTRPLEEVVTELGSRGVAFKGEIFNDEQGGVKLAFFTDPDGTELYLCEQKWG